MVESNTKNILQITTDFGKGGAERVFSQLSQELNKRYKVYDCVFNQDIQRTYKSDSQVLDLKTPSTNNSFKKIYYFFLRIRRAKKVKKKYNIQVSLSHLEGADYINILSRYREKIVLCIHGSKINDQDIQGFTGWIRKKVLMPWLYKKADLIVAVSHGIKRELVSSFRISADRIVVIENFFDIEAIEHLAAETLPANEEHFFRNNDVLVSSGRFARQKNQAFIIGLFPRLLKKWPELKLVILGDGPLKDELVALAEELNLRIEFDLSAEPECQIYFPGYETNPFKYISRSKIFLLPSLWEGFPLVLCESMIVNTPVIAFDCPTGPREIILPEATEPLTKLKLSDYGVLIPLNDEIIKMQDDWLTAIGMLLKDQKLADDIRSAARKRIEEFNKDVIFRKWISAINQL